MPDYVVTFSTPALAGVISFPPYRQSTCSEHGSVNAWMRTLGQSHAGCQGENAHPAIDTARLQESFKAITQVALRVTHRVMNEPVKVKMHAPSPQ